MAKQLCDPFRGGLTAQMVGHVRPGVAVTKGDLMARDPARRGWVVPFSEIATVALAHTNFIGVATGGMATDEPDRRLVLNYKGAYMYPLVTDAEVIAGDYVIPVLNAGSTACRAQEWNVSTTSTYAIGVVNKNMPDHDLYYDSTFLTSIAATGTQADPMVVTCTAHGLSVGDLCRLYYTAGTVSVPSGTICKVATAADADTLTLDELDGTDVACTGTMTAGHIETVQYSRISDEAEAVISTTLFAEV